MDWSLAPASSFSSPVTQDEESWYSGYERAEKRLEEFHDRPGDEKDKKYMRDVRAIEAANNESYVEAEMESSSSSPVKYDPVDLTRDERTWLRGEYPDQSALLSTRRGGRKGTEAKDGEGAVDGEGHEDEDEDDDEDEEEEVEVDGEGDEDEDEDEDVAG